MKDLKLVFLESKQNLDTQGEASCMKAMIFTFRYGAKIEEWHNYK